jgi:CubicO group peptidase (beta-lactamase class C family)
VDSDDVLGPAAAALPEVDRIADEFLASGRSPGLAYAVVRGGAVAHAGGRGEARVGGPVPTSATVFRIASMTKSFLAATLLALRDEGRVVLDEPVATYVPELHGLALPTRDSRPPTVRDLLTMSTGWPTDDPWADRSEQMTRAELSAELSAGLTFDTAPGIAFDYSNLSYAVIGRIVSNTSGGRFQDAVNARVLQPLGLVSTAFRADDVDAELLADGHVRRDGQWQVEPTSSTGEFAAIGGLFSSCDDLARWVGVLCGAFPPRDDDDPAVPAARATLREMQQAHRLYAAERGVPGDLARPGEVEAYGFGLFVSLHPRFGTIVSHPGGYPGFGSRMVWHPETGIGVIGLANGRYGGPYRDTQRMLLALLDAADAPARAVTVPSSAARLYDDVDRLLDSWDDALLDSIAATNLDGDVPRELRARETADAIAHVGGELGSREEVAVRTPSSAVWWRRGPVGRLRVEVLLTPQVPQRVQTLDLRAVPDPAPAVSAAAERVATALWAGAAWPSDVPRGPGVDVDRLAVDAARARAAGVVSAVLEPWPVAASSPRDTTFELRGPDMHAHLQLALDEGGVVTSCSLTVLGDPWPTAVRGSV